MSHVVRLLKVKYRLFVVLQLRMSYGLSQTNNVVGTVCA